MTDDSLLHDRFVDFVLHEVLEAVSLCALPHFADHDRATFDLYLSAARRFARGELFATYRPMDETPPSLREGRVHVHPDVARTYRGLAELGVVAATRPFDVGGQQLPLTVATFAHAYLMAANLSAYGYAGLTTGAAHLIEAFGDASLRATYMRPLYEGRWTGTMALTEPQAGSSLADVATRATPTSDGHYLLRGDKIFISGGDHDALENVVHLALARIDGAPLGTKGISLFVVPKLRPEDGGLVPNDVYVTGLIHKIGWKGLPSVALSFGDAGDCRGWLVGAPGEGLRCMFQMMNEARLMVGLNAASTASVAYRASVRYALERTQGRSLTSKDATSPPVPIVEHPDVRRMLVRQKSIVEGALALLGITARFADLSEHATDEATRSHAKKLLDLLTPIAKTFPAEKGFEANALALQVHGGYGYSSEYLPESWLRDQKLNSIHEGTTTIQGLDLLGRKVVAGGGASLIALGNELVRDVAEAQAAGLPEADGQTLVAAFQRWVAVTTELGGRGAAGDVEGMMAHSADYLELASIIVLAWVWTKLRHHAARRLARTPDDTLARGLEHAAQYWLVTELPRVPALADLCVSRERSYLDARPEWL